MGYLAQSVGLRVGGESSLWEGVFLFSYSLGIKRYLIPFLEWEYCGNQELWFMDLFWHLRLCLWGSLLFTLLIPITIGFAVPRRVCSMFKGPIVCEFPKLWWHKLRTIVAGQTIRATIVSKMIVQLQNSSWWGGTCEVDNLLEIAVIIYCDHVLFLVELKEVYCYLLPGSTGYLMV